MRCIYGAGDYGKRLYQYMNEKKYKDIDFFCQSQDDGRSEYCGKPLFTADYLYDIDDRIEIFIAICNRTTSRMICEDICDNVSSSDISIIQCGDFISQNLVDQDYVIKIFYMNHNAYEEGVAKAYWTEYFEDEARLEQERGRLINGLNKEDQIQIDLIISRMKELPLKNYFNDIFTAPEKCQIRRVEREFKPVLTKMGGVEVEWVEAST